MKKVTLNKDDMKKYRSLRNFSFLSKILEEDVASRLNSHINSSHISNYYQSAHRKFHSTVNALLKIHNDILSSMEDGTVTAMTLFHLSAAFDTTDHIIQSINQTNKLLQRQYPRRSEAQWRHSQISVQQQSPGNSSVTSTGHEQ